MTARDEGDDGARASGTPSASTRRLDRSQVAAATAEAPVQLTLAGPGSGKTSTLTGRFVHLVRRGVDPSRILAVTFTRKAADEMRFRIEKLIALPAASSLPVMTFHAFAYRLLKRDPGASGLDPQFRLWDTPEQRHVFSSRQMWWNEETDILDIIGGAKERLMDAERFAAVIGADDDVEVEAAKFFRVYQQALKDACAIDFADMVPLVVKAMDRNEAYRRAITGAYDHLLVDEYQDVNPGQIGLIDHFVRDGVKLWAVGDDDQTLYAFRASDVRYVLEFTTKYPAAPIHVLDRNYRSAAGIVLAAKRLIRHNRMRVDKDYLPTIAEPGELVIRGYPSPDHEARHVALAIATLIKRGTAPEHIALLYRTAAVGLPLQIVLKQMGIPFEVRGGADLWQGVAAKLVAGALFYLRDRDDPQAAGRLGTTKRGQILRDRLDAIRPIVRDRYADMCDCIGRIVGEAVPSRSADREKAEWRTVVDAVVALARSCSSLAELEVKIAEQSRTLREPPKAAVTLSTIHSAKGLEWDAVFVVGMEDGVLPHANSDDVEEERRVAYVGLTRARRRLGLTYAAERYGERSKPSPFLFEIAGREQRLCAWTGPKADGAATRLPLLTADEQRRLADPAAPVPSGRRASGAASRVTPRARSRKRD